MVMNNMNMAMNGANPAMGGIPMMGDGPNGAMARQPSDNDPADMDARLNSWLYGYLVSKEQWDLARALKNSSLSFFPPLGNSGNEMNGTNEDSKANLGDNKRPGDLPPPGPALDNDGGSLLSGWFAVFWDLYAAHHKKQGASAVSMRLMEQNRVRGQSRGEQLMRMNSMVPNQMDPNMQMMYRNGDLRKNAFQNNQQNGSFRGAMNTQQMQMAMAQRNAQAMIQQQNMRRDPQNMDMNGQRPRTPSSADHAPSPKRARMDTNGFGAQQMMSNGRPPPGMPPAAMMDGTAQANAALLNGGINPGNLSDTQLQSFQSQQPSVQQKSIQVYAQNMGKGRNEVDMGMPPGVPDYYNGQMMRPGPLPPGATVNGGGGEHALQDYQMQLMLLEQQNKKRLLMARQEQDGPGQPGMSFPANGMSPQGSRGGPSPGPGAERRGTPKLGQQSMDGSPLPDGSMRGSPAAMQNFNQAQPPELYNSINPGVRPPPSSNPAFVAAQFPQQQMEQMRRMPNGNWQQGPQAHAAMPQQATNPQQPPQMGTPQQRNEMPPPQAPTAPTANGRIGSDEAPPTPQPTNKANPKPKKDTKKKGEGKGKKNAGSVAATPASEAENPPPTPTPSTPITPSHPQSFGQKESLQGNPNPSTNGAATQQMQPPQQDVMSTATFDPNVHNASDGDAFGGAFNDQMQGPDLLDNFDFEEFLDQNAFNMEMLQNDSLEAAQIDV